MTWRVDVGDCVDLMAAMPACSVDAVVCDPPYGLEFMGKEWDRLGATASAFEESLTEDGRVDYHEKGNAPFGGGGQRVRYGLSAKTMQEWHHRWATEALRVLKPGGHLLAFGGTRTSHRLACAIEDAGFEIRDTIVWLYGSGFPKSLDVGKAIDKQAGAERETTGRDGRQAASSWLGTQDGIDSTWGRGEWDKTDRPATPDAERWDGWGTALKPAHEPIVVARKPLAGTVAANVLEYGTGGLNVDGCRVGESGGRTVHTRSDGNHRDRWEGNTTTGETTDNGGRWPANVVVDEQAAAMLDQQSGERASGKMMPTAVRSTDRNAYGRDAENGYTTMETYGDSGGASRFFYTAKASRAERNAGLDGFEEAGKPSGGHGNGEPDPISVALGSQRTARNHHPTVKPVSLMRWLVRLVTPPDGLVLDPFTGSGTTGIAAVLEGFNFAGCEQDDGYANIARARVGWWELHGHDALRIVAEQEAAENERNEIRASGQMELL